jgi:hypothetical protein
LHNASFLLCKFARSSEDETVIQGVLRFSSVTLKVVNYRLRYLVESLLSLLIVKSFFISFN